MSTEAAKPSAAGRSPSGDPPPDSGAISSLMGRVVGNYQIVQYLGAGAMGSVYLARHLRIGQEVAFKMLHRHLVHNHKLVQRFEDEARAVARIGHRNIVQIYDFGELPDGRCYFVMERLLGRNLGKLIAQAAPLPPAITAAIAREVLLALGAAHKAQVVHRDLKPDNVFVIEEDAAQPVIKVLDFGIAKLRGERSGSKGLTETGMVYGTPQYIAPEQAEGVEDIDGRADLYALGVVMFEMLTGRLPFTGGPGELLAAHVFTPPPDPRTLRPDLPASIVELVLRALAKSRDARFASAEEMLSEIDRLGVLPGREATEQNIRPAARAATAPRPARPSKARAPEAAAGPAGRPSAAPPPEDVPGKTLIIEPPAPEGGDTDRQPEAIVATTAMEAIARRRMPLWVPLVAAIAIAVATGTVLALTLGGEPDRPARVAADSDDREPAGASDRTSKPARPRGKAHDGDEKSTTAAASADADRRPTPEPERPTVTSAPESEPSVTAMPAATAAPKPAMAKTAAVVKTAAPKSALAKPPVAKTAAAKATAAPTKPPLTKRDGVLRPGF